MTHYSNSSSYATTSLKRKDALLYDDSDETEEVLPKRLPTCILEDSISNTDMEEGEVLQSVVARPPPPPPPQEPGSSRTKPLPPIIEMARATGIRSVTCVDPGTRNLGIVRMSFDGVIRLTHVRCIDLDEICTELEQKRPNICFGGEEGSNRSMQARIGALRQYVIDEVQKGGIFDSDMCLVETQSFDRVMARVEETILSIFNQAKPPVVILAGIRGATIFAGLNVAGTSVKAAYRPLFPIVSAHSVAERREKRRLPHGVGDVNRAIESVQHAENKKNARRWGSLLVPPHSLMALIPAENLTEYDRVRLAKRKSDDFYDALLMCLYFASNTLFRIHSIKQRGCTKILAACEALAPRASTRYEEIVQFIFATTNDNSALYEIMSALGFNLSAGQSTNQLPPRKRQARQKSNSINEIPAHK